MKYTQSCPCCGQITTAYSHNINRQMVGVLRQLVDFYEENRKPANLQRDLKLTKNQYNNFQKLQYFGVVVRTQHGWYPTEIGMDFIYGDRMIYNPVATFGSNILPIGHEAWKTATKQPQQVAVQEIDETSYKRRENYQEEKSNQTKMF